MPTQSDTSKMRTMFLWSSRATARASLSASSSKPARGRRNLSATSRCSVLSVARKTWPMPPPPIHSRTWYLRPSGPPSHSPGIGSSGNGSSWRSFRRKESSRSEAPQEARPALGGTPPCSPSRLAFRLISRSPLAPLLQPWREWRGRSCEPGRTRGTLQCRVTPGAGASIRGPSRSRLCGASRSTAGPIGMMREGFTVSWLQK